MKGTYCLIIELKEDSLISIGKLGKQEFKRGFYVYVGSALNSLDKRVQRHLSSKKKIFWHIDYFLNHPDTEIKDVIVVVLNKKIECEIARLIHTQSHGVSQFGCSDCKCNSHLFYFSSLEEAVSAVEMSFNKLKLNMQHWKDIKE